MRRSAQGKHLIDQHLALIERRVRFVLTEHVPQLLFCVKRLLQILRSLCVGSDVGIGILTLFFMRKEKLDGGDCDRSYDQTKQKQTA